MPEDDVTTVKVKRDTWLKLNGLKMPGDSFDDVISKLLEEADDEGNQTPKATAN